MSIRWIHHIIIIRTLLRYSQRDKRALPLPLVIKARVKTFANLPSLFVLSAELFTVWGWVQIQVQVFFIWYNQVSFGNFCKFRILSSAPSASFRLRCRAVRVCATCVAQSQPHVRVSAQADREAGPQYCSLLLVDVDLVRVHWAPFR